MKVKLKTLQNLVQRNVYSRGKHCYDEQNAMLCTYAMVKYGWEHPCWLTENQISNPNGKYLIKGLAVLKGESPRVVIAKADHADPNVMVRTPVYNIGQTNMAQVAPGAYELMCNGRSFDEVCTVLIHQPLIKRADHGRADEPRGFFRALLGKAVTL